MKVIFLDVDGVLNCTKTVRGWGKMRFIDTRKMLRVREICERTGAKVVISSSWRDGALEDANPWDKRMWQALLAEFDKHRIPVIGMTPLAPDRWRGDEINMWLKLQEEPVEDFVIVDDIVCDLTKFVSVGRVVQTVDEWGLTKEKMEECIKILGEAQ
jgi:histidinol phosphatase-like enzyme